MSYLWLGPLLLLAPPADWPLVGRLGSRPASAIAASDWSIGCETLDRDFAVYERYKAYVGPLGAKHARLQAGWAKCERQRGVYDWAWLDAIVDDLRAQGVAPWLETSYGNPLYPGGGGTGLGAGLPRSPEALDAWDRWVSALVAHFKDRVDTWEVWNEPDGTRSITPESYAALYVRTARLIRAAQPTARLYGLGLAGNVQFATGFVQALADGGHLGLLDALTVHTYPENPDWVGVVGQTRAMLAKLAPRVTVRQGETGAPSTAGTVGALRNRAWNETLQAKYDLRRMLAHRALDVPFNLFTLMDLAYTQPGMTGLNTKGLLAGAPDKTVDHPKLAYAAAQRVMGLFDSRLARLTDYPFTATPSAGLTLSGYRGEAGQVVAVWLKQAPPTADQAYTLHDLVLPRGAFREPVWVDLLTGAVRAVPSGQWQVDGTGVAFGGVPVYDSPILLAERAALTLQ